MDRPAVILETRISQAQPAEIGGFVFRPFDLVIDCRSFLQVRDSPFKLPEVDICHSQLMQVGGLRMAVFNSSGRSPCGLPPLYAFSRRETQVNQQFSYEWIAAAQPRRLVIFRGMLRRPFLRVLDLLPEKTVVQCVDYLLDVLSSCVLIILFAKYFFVNTRIVQTHLKVHTPSLIPQIH
jgi:hypothetical protein